MKVSGGGSGMGISQCQDSSLALSRAATRFHARSSVLASGDTVGLSSLSLSQSMRYCVFGTVMLYVCLSVCVCVCVRVRA
jgi:hypothetical protein